jgi:truncated hemoglobin YjbI
MKQISIQITDETARQMARLAKYWGLPPERHNTAVIERAVATIFMFEIGCIEYAERLEQMQKGSEATAETKQDSNQEETTSDGNNNA